MDHGSVAIRKHLNLDVARTLQEPLQVDRGIPERLLRLALRPLDRYGEISGAADDPHPLASAARCGLEHQRIAELAGRSLRLRPPADGRRAGHHGHTGILHQLPGPRLVPHSLDRFGRRADERQSGFLSRPGEDRVLGQKAVPRVDGLCPRVASRFDEPADVQVTLGRSRRSDRNGKVGLQHVGSQAIGLRVHRHGLDAELAAGPKDTDGDLAPVRDQDPGERRLPQRGMLPCFLGGFRSRLFASTCRPEIRCCRVWRGSMTSSTYPRAAAW